ncbi:MAG: glycoside hydrolase family 2 protein [Anaerolineales bacterium]|nr:glycoside hydrolase family 2 protein [Anaerolineales bacterium]
MQTQPLTGSWQFRQYATSDWLPATVPGGVHTDLLALGKIPDPFVSDYEKDVQWVAETDWEYQTTFDATTLTEEKTFLICEGLDTLADVTLNGELLGHTDNMFRRREWDVTDLLRPTGNVLHLHFSSPVRFVADKQAQLPLVGGSGAIPGGPHLRKAPCHWGWDWGPQLPAIGIWKDIRLEGHSTASLTHIHLRQHHHEDDSVTISADVEIEDWSEDHLTLRLIVTTPTGETHTTESNLTPLGDEYYHADLHTEILDPQLWWPNGYGDQPLYHVEITLLAGDRPLDTRTHRIGLRTLDLVQEPDAWGKSFTFYVNGLPIFAKGANWIPADSFPTRVTRASLEGLIRSAAQANMNMLRVWGGGYYPEDMFFDLCDEYGLLIWQDFMFACAIYPADAEFFENVRAEAIENIRRIRHHPSLAIWCGNNEMEQGWCDWGWNQPHDPLNQRLKDGYDRMFHHLLPELIADEDPDTPYWPSSASSGTPFENPNGQVQGDCHYWDVWHGRKPFTAYRAQFPRFMSEFGFQALPPLKTIQTYAPPEEWNLTSYIMEHHQRSWVGNSLMIAQMADTFRMPKNFDALVYLSLILQAEGIRYGVEHWRRNRQRVSGTIIWQLDDCWPVASWASLDYFGRWKALHYAAKRFYAPLLLSVEDTGKTMSVHITSDLPDPCDVTVRWRLETLSGEILASGEKPLRAHALQDTRVGVYDFSAQVTEANQRHVVFVCELWQNAEHANTVTLFVPNKHLSLQPAEIAREITAENGTLSITLRASSLARFVELEFPDADLVFSDNYFDLSPNQARTLTAPLPAGWTVEQAREKLRIRTLADSY